MRILWHSDPAWCGTGYGNQTRLFTRKITELGHKVAVSVTSGLGFNKVSMSYGKDLNVEHYPSVYNDDHGIKSIPINIAWFDPDVLVTLKDLPLYRGKTGKFNASWVPYFPVDFDRLVKPIREMLNDSIVPTTMSKWGVEVAEKAGCELYYLPHGIDTNVFVNRGHSGSCKEQLGFSQDCFLVGMVAMNSTNPSRKSFPECFRAMKEIMNKHKDVCFYVHTDPHGKAGGINLIEMVKEYEMENVRFANIMRLYTGCYNEDWLVDIYNAIDVLLSPSKAEGFGLPIIEAQSCGVPVIVNDFSSMPELVGDGQICEVAAMEYINLGRHSAIPREDSIVDCLEEAYRKGKDYHSGQARNFVVDNYDIDFVFDRYGIPWLEKIKTETLSKGGK